MGLRRRRPASADDRSCLTAGEELARGIANRYRRDLAEARYGTGWCGFRLKLCDAVGRPPQVNLSLWAGLPQPEIYQAAALPVVAEDEPGIVTLADVVSPDPTVVHSIEQLRGCDQIFRDFIKLHSVEVFVSIAHVYVLGRGPDAPSLAIYSASLRAGTVSPYELLKSLYESDEFRFEPRLLIAPPQPALYSRYHDDFGWAVRS